LWVGLAVTVVALLILQQFWHWEVERIEVPAGKVVVRIHKWGKDLPPDAIVAPDDSYKGVMQDVWAEGRFFLNPIFWSHEIHGMVTVPPGQCLVLTRLFGKPIPPERLAAGDILAREDERGIVGEVLTPGSYRLNPYAYKWEAVPAVEIGFNQVGVRTLKVGKDPSTLPAVQRRSPYVVPAGYRGVQQEPVASGTHYINPFVETITPVEVASHIVEFTDIKFPSRDGFLLNPIVQVEYQVQPPKAAELLVRLSTEGKLHQEDRTEEEKKKNEILQKIVLPHMRGHARIEGSNLDAKDVIITDSGKPGQPNDKKSANIRERLQKTLLEKIRPQCEEVGIEIRTVRLAALEPPPDLVEQISARDVARVHLEKNKTLLEQFKTRQQLQAAEAMTEQASEKVRAETRRVQTQTQANQRKEVETLRLKQELENAHLKLEAARAQAKAVLAKGKVEADVINLQNEAEVAGLRKAVQGFTNVQYFAQYHILKKLAPALTEIFTSDDSEFARLFGTYMTPPAAPAPTKAALKKGTKDEG
jgi:regulator of protease activity HflC (stomatin/prohibitin superfamily)